LALTSDFVSLLPAFAIFPLWQVDFGVAAPTDRRSVQLVTHPMVHIPTHKDIFGSLFPPNLGNQVRMGRPLSDCSDVASTTVSHIALL
jgi:hypothetical protein